MTGWHFSRASALLLICYLLSGCDRKAGEALPPPLHPAEPISAEAIPAPSPAPAVAVAESPLPQDGSTDERVRAVILQHSAAVKSISSYRTDIAWEERHFDETPLDQPLPEGQLYTSGEGALLWQEGKWRAEHRNRMDGIDPMAEYMVQHKGLKLKAEAVKEKYDTWAVFDGEYLTRRNSQFGHNLYCNPRDGIDYQVFLFPNPLNFGFNVAPRNGTFETIFATSQLPTHKPVTHWALDSLESAEGGRKIRISRNIDVERGIWETRFLIDPDRDFLAVGMDAWYPPNGKIDEYRLELQQLADGHWFPREARYRTRDSYSRWVFSKVSVNLPIDPAMFTLESIPCDPDLARLIRKDLDGSGKVYLFRGGQWVPESLVPKHLRPARKSAENGGADQRRTTEEGSSSESVGVLSGI